MTEHLLIKPNPSDVRLTRAVSGVDHNGAPQEIRVAEERPLTTYLNSQEIVTAIYDEPKKPTRKGASS